MPFMPSYELQQVGAMMHGLKIFFMASLNIHFLTGPSPNNRVVGNFFVLFSVNGRLDEFSLLEHVARGKKEGIAQIVAIEF
ncbi:hypothetical protein NC653_021191 [Populus alba x Populus x berolinensis]|uniref:Uncharacterized protein n=1 Tax=Populus alba x Populus x berolinensis TaxID=444605 RepID=A0AAD6MMZ5_9ROSI|nr:hypothetical protein NC653_021191 [Populus alba x Populus x berolinensis]